MPSSRRTQPAASVSGPSGMEPIEMDMSFEPMTPDEDFTVPTDAPESVERAPGISHAQTRPGGLSRMGSNGGASVAATAQSTALGGLFRKRAALPHEMIEDNAPPQFMQPPPSFPQRPGFHAGPPAPDMGHRSAASRNPFLTAGEKLQVCWRVARALLSFYTIPDRFDTVDAA